MEEEYQELWKEDGMYWEYFKEKQIDRQKLDELVVARYKDYELVAGEEEMGAGLEDRVPKVDLEE